MNGRSNEAAPLKPGLRPNRSKMTSNQSHLLLMDQDYGEDYDQLSQDGQDEFQEDGWGQDQGQPDQLDGEQEFLPLQEPKAKPADQHAQNYQKVLGIKEEVQENAPLLCVVQGPPKSGKSTLIQSLVKHYTGQKVNEVKGSLTMRAGKKQRITFVQCPNNMSQMIDLAKVADIALVMIDASIGFQMETFQFLSLLKTHELPNVMGVLNHLDYFKDGKQLKKTRKKYKNRFEGELGSNYRLFYLQGIKNGGYLKREVMNMARFLSVIKYSKSKWKLDHPYLMVDRFQVSEEIRDKDPEDQVDVLFNGYVRNCSYRLGSKLHFLGLGDFEIKSWKVLDDPCPTLDKGVFQAAGQDNSQEDNQAEQPEPEKSKKKKGRRLKQKQRILYAPASSLGLLSVQQTGGYITVPDEHVVYTRREDQEEGELEEGVRMVRQLQQKGNLQEGNERAQLLDGIQLEDDEKEPDKLLSLREKSRQLRRLRESTRNAFQEEEDQEIVQFGHDQQKTDLFELIYKSQQQVCQFDSDRYVTQKKLDRKEFQQKLRSRFVTGVDFDPEEMADKKQEEEQEKQPFQKLQFSEQTNFIRRGKYLRVVLSGIKKKHVQAFDYRLPMVLCKINVAEDTKGFIVAKVRKHPWYTNLLKSGDPIIISSGWRRYQVIPTFYITNLNKLNDKNRYLKYTPQYDFCWVAFYGNFCAQGSGLLMTQTLNDKVKKFRIAATGFIVELSQQPDIYKKLKLVGEPFKIFKNTAFVKGMFNSVEEVQKYEGAVIKTVSGLRGQVKKAVKEGGEGCFRATFQDKILKSDIIFCKTWFKMSLDKFYNPIVNFEPLRLMKTTWQLRRQRGLSRPQAVDSAYREIERAPKKFMPFEAPKKLQGNLPFEALQKIRISKKKKMQAKQEESIPKLTGTNSQREIQSLIQRLHIIRNQKVELKKQKMDEHERIKTARDMPRRKTIENNQRQKQRQKFIANAKQKDRDQKPGKRARKEHSK